MAETTLPAEYTRAPARGDVVGRLLGSALTVNWYTIAYVLIFLVAIFTRFYDLGARVMSHDESLHVYYSYRLFRDGDFQHTPLMHGPILFHITAFIYFLFGDNDFTGRIYPAVLGVLMVMFPLLFRRWLGRYGALLASIMILISPLLLFHHRYIREDTPSIFASIVMVYCTFMYIDGPMHLRRKARWLYIFAGAMLWSLGSKETAFMYIAIFGSFLTLYWLARLIQHLRKVPTKTLFYFAVIPALLGGTVALIMYVVLSITLSTSPTLDGRAEFLLQQFRQIGSAPLTLEFSMFSSWTLLTLAGLVAVIFGTALWAFRSGTVRLRLREIVIVIALTLFVTTGLILVEEVSKLPSRAEELQVDPENDQLDLIAETNAPIVAVWVGAAAVIAVMLYAWRAGWWVMLRRFPEFDILLLMGTLVLPWLTAVFTYLTGASPTDYSQAGLIRSAAVLVPLAMVSITAGLLWNPKRWLIAAAVFHILFAFFFTTMFTNPMGLATGMVGSLGYWLEQQGVRRGSQPQYYYQLIIMPIYEYLPLIGSFVAMFAGLTGFWAFRRERRARIEWEEAALAAGELENTPEAEAQRKQADLWGSARLRRPSFILFTSWWAVYNFIAYTLAGEKMPWLGTHITTPMIFITAWYFGGVFERVDWARFRKRGWLYLLLFPLLIVAVFQTIAPFLVGQNPFAGLTTSDQALRNQWFGVLALVALIGFLIYQVVRRTGWLHFRRMIGVAAFVGLSLLTFRTAWMAAFINYDYATEYLVYAHGAPGVKLMMEQIEELSRRTTGGMSMRFAWGGNSWPVTWYFRNLTNATFFGGNPTADALRDAVAVYASHDIRARVEPLLEDRYYRFEYMRMWWPSWNYYNLSAQRVANAWDFNPTNTQAAEIRRGIWDIWWARDHTRYGRAVGEDTSLQNWNPGERLYFYVRKDIAAQIWNLGVGEGTVLNPLEGVGVNLCTENWQQQSALLAFNLPPGSAALNHPIDIEVSDDGRVFVAEEFSNRVLEYDVNGQFVGVVDGFQGSNGFNRPNGVAVDMDGDLIVADTWNYRIGIFNRAGEFLRGWGQPGQYGASAGLLPTDGFWGPRDVAVDAEGNIYVADTGNKRIRVYDSEGTHLRDIGSAGSGAGQLDEPSGITISPDGRLFIADTWNRRVSVFHVDGTPLFTFSIRGWYEDQGNRPYLAVDPERNLLYVTDPDAGRVLVFDTQGNCVGSFGQPTDNAVALTQFETVAGIDVGPDGSVYVVDSEAGRVLKFAPFALPEAAQNALQDSPAEALSGEQAGGVQNEGAADAESTAEAQG